MDRVRGQQVEQILTLDPRRFPFCRPGLFRRQRTRKRLGCRTQFLGVERFSFLPNCQRNGCNLPCQSEPSHLRPQPFLLETFQILGPGIAATTRNGGGNEDRLQTSVAVPVQSPGGHRFGSPLDTTRPELVFRTAVRHDGQAARCRIAASGICPSHCSRCVTC